MPAEHLPRVGWKQRIAGAVTVVGVFAVPGLAMAVWGIGPFAHAQSKDRAAAVAALEEAKTAAAPAVDLRSIGLRDRGAGKDPAAGTLVLATTADDENVETYLKNWEYTQNSALIFFITTIDPSPVFIFVNPFSAFNSTPTFGGFGSPTIIIFNTPTTPSQVASPSQLPSTELQLIIDLLELILQILGGGRSTQHMLG